MTGQPIRDPLADHLTTPENAALVLIDYQPEQIAAVGSMIIRNSWGTPSRRSGR